MALNSAVTDVQWSPNYSSGRPAGDPTGITAHHWGEDGQNHQGVVDYLCDGNRPGPTSAHYVVSDGRVTQLVHDYDRAWHAGPSGNPRNIGIELRPEMSAGDFETAARLIAAIRAEWGPLPLNKHNDFMNTACPGRWASQLSRLSARADAINRGQTTPTAPAKPATGRRPRLDDDEYLGAKTQIEWALINGTTPDGVISSQDESWRHLYGERLTCVEWVPSSQAEGSALIARVQIAFRDAGLYHGDIDGLIGPQFIAAFIAYYGGATLPRAISNLQRAINKQLGY